jgi:hypothetical protein
MGLTRICSGLLIAVGLLLVAGLSGASQQIAPGAWAQEQTTNKRPVRRHARRGKPRTYALESGASPSEIARYFALYGGYIDPSINKQSQGGPFDSGFFFDSGMGANGGDSPYMN